MGLVQNPNWPLVTWQANFAQGANGPIPQTWVDLTPRVVDWQVTAGKQHELDTIEAGTVTATVRNADEALNPANPSSPWNTGGNSLKPYRWIRGWAQWPCSGGGNLLNSTNDVWAATAGAAGSFADTASLEGGVGTWTVTAGCTLASSTAHVHDGAKSMLVTWATTAGGSGVANLSTPVPPLQSGATYTASVWVYLGSGPAVTVWVNGNTATSTTTTGAWQRVTCTFVADSTITPGVGIYSAGATTSGQQVWVDSVQLEAASTASSFTTTGPTCYPIHTGFIETYPLSWKHMGFEGWATLTGVDALGLMSRQLLDNVLTQEMLADTPDLMWPLDDDSTSATAANIGAKFPNAARMVLCPFGSPTTATTKFGGSSSPGLDSGSTAEFAPASAAATYAPLIDWAGSTGYTIGGTGQAYTVEFWFSSSSKLVQPMRILRAWATGQEELGVTLTSAGNLQMIHRGASGTIDATVTSLGTYKDTGWHQVACTAYAVGSTVYEDLYVDGRHVAGATRTGTPMVGRGVVLGYGVLEGGEAYVGNVSRLAVYPTVVPLARLASHWIAGKTGFAGDLTGTRIARILAWANWAGPTVLPAGSTRCGGAAGLQDSTTATAAQVAAATERGSFLALPDGRLALIPRTAFTTQTVSKATFGEHDGSGETPYLDGTVSLDPQFIYNVVKVERAGGSTMVATDHQSGLDYGQRVAELQTGHATDADALSMAIWLVGQYKDPHLRVPSLVIEPSSNPNLWPVALGVKHGDRVTFKRRTSAGVTISLDGYVTRIEHDVKPDSWQVTYQIAPVDTIQAGIIGDATYGVVGSTFIPGY